MSRDDNDRLRENQLSSDPSDGLAPADANGNPIDGWPEPSPLRSHSEAPPFPADSLPSVLRDWALATAHEFQCPIDLPASLALGVISCACGGWVQVRVRDNWVEPVNLFLAVALRSGEKKSPAVGRATEPVQAFERAESERLQSWIADIESRRIHLDEQIGSAKRALRKASHEKGIEIERELAEYLIALKNLPKARAPRYIADDITQEKLGGLLQENGERMALFSAEGGGFRLMAGYYNDGKANLDIYLKAYSGEPITVDRITRDPVRLDRPCLTICLAVQPAVIKKLEETPEIRDFGMLARFLLCVPESLVGKRNHRAEPVPQPLLDEYSKVITRILERGRMTDQMTLPEMHTLRLCPDGYEVLMTALDEVEPRLAVGGDLHPYSDWMNKIAGRIARIAGLLHVFKEADAEQEQGTIPIECVREAKRIHDFYLDHAQIGLDLLGADPAINKAEHLLAWARRQGQPVFTRRDAHRGCRSMFPRSEALLAPLAVLLDRGWIRKLPDPTSRGVGRPSDRYELYPGQNCQNRQKAGDQPDSVLSVDSDHPPQGPQDSE